MCKRKRVRKFLNIFLCVISIVAVFSVTAMAVDYSYVYGTGVSLTSGFTGETFFSIDFASDENRDPRLFKLVVAKQEFSLSYNGEMLHKGSLTPYEWIVDMNTGEIFYPDSEEIYIFQFSSIDRYYNLRLVSSSDPVDAGYVLSSVDSVFDVLTDFATFISGNALLLLFAIGLPVCSFGVGLLIRLKERT